MAVLKYNPNGSTSVTFNGITNDVLVVLQRVMEERFSSGEGFWFEYDGNAVWLHPSIPILLNYDTDQPIRYSRESMANMLKRSQSPLGVSFGQNGSFDRAEIIDEDWEDPDRAADADGGQDGTD